MWQVGAGRAGKMGTMEIEQPKKKKEHESWIKNKRTHLPSNYIGKTRASPNLLVKFTVGRYQWYLQLDRCCEC